MEHKKSMGYMSFRDIKHGDPTENSYKASTVYPIHLDKVILILRP